MIEIAELVEKAREGSPEAFSEIVRRFQSRVRAYLAGYVRDGDVVDDLAQETFLSAYRGLSSYRGKATLGVWLVAIARNLAVSYLRDQVRKRAHEGGLVRSTLDRLFLQRIESDSLDPAEEDRGILALEECLGTLPPHSAELVQGHYFGNRSAAELARSSGKNDSTVRVTLVRIRQALRRCVELRLGPSEMKA